MSFIVSFFVILFAAMVQGATGFGFSLVAVPLLSFVMPLDLIVPILVLFSLILNVVVFVKLEGHIDKKKIALLVLLGMIGLPIGIYILRFVNEDYIKFVVGVLVMISSLAMYFNVKAHFKNVYFTYGAVGLISGILNGSSSLSGPPVILMLSNEGVNKSDFRKTLATYFMVLNIVSIPMFFLQGLITSEVIKSAAFRLPGMLIGVYLGLVIGHRIPEKLFRKITLVMIFIMGIITTVSVF
ncbi:MAG: sulfite exporter TauE/SafE family protein [Clostridia bacterium]|nr:sulfite exporter TauE/SafE family protein [Clostridia bacterium]